MNLNDIARHISNMAEAHGLGYLICLLDHASDESIVSCNNVDAGDVLVWFDRLTRELDFSPEALLEIMRETWESLQQHPGEA